MTPDEAQRAAAGAVLQDLMMGAGATEVGRVAGAAGIPTAVPFGLLTRSHPSRRPAHWTRCRALLEGGEALLGNDAVMRDVFPQNEFEPDHIYRDRRRRAHYANDCGVLIQHLVSGIFVDPLVVEVQATQDHEKAFLEGFAADCSPGGGPVISLNDHLRLQLMNALAAGGVAWTMIGLPDSGGVEYSNLAAQIESGTLDAYACAIPPECVIDWEEDEAGDLTFAVMHTEIQRRASPFAVRDEVIQRFVVWTPSSISTYEIKHKADRPPSERDPVSLVSHGEHPFGRVPLLRLELPDGLRAMEQLESLARAHLNERNSLSRATLMALYPQFFVFLADEEPGNESEPANEEVASASRAVNQLWGHGTVKQLRAGDRVEWAAPHSGPFEMALAGCNSIVEAMGRVVHGMALMADPKSASAIGRSGASKEADRAMMAIVQRAYGALLKRHALAMYELARRGRGDTGEAKIAVRGFYDVGVMSVDQAIKEATDLALVEIPSPTLKTELTMRLATRLMGESGTPKLLTKIRGELEAGFGHTGGLTDEQIAADYHAPDEETKGA